MNKSLYNSTYFFWRVVHGSRPGRYINHSRIRLYSAPSKREQIQRKNRVHIEASWNPLDTHPEKTIVKDDVPSNQVKNKKGNVIHIKRLFYWYNIYYA